METKEQLVQQIKGWMANDNEMRDLQSRLKELKEKRKKEYLELESAQLQQQLEENQQSYNYEIIGSTPDEIENMKILYLDSINEAIEERKRLVKSIRYREERGRLKPRDVKFGNTHVIFREIKYLKSL
jgi:hypothetical protein